MGWSLMAQVTSGPLAFIAGNSLKDRAEQKVEHDDSGRSVPTRLLFSFRLLTERKKKT